MKVESHFGHHAAVEKIRLRGGGLVVVGANAARIRDNPLRMTPSGAMVHVTLPSELATYTAIVVFEIGQNGYGFQVMPRGAGALAYPHDIAVEIEGPVTLGDGTMVFFRDVNADQPTEGLTVWQGPHHDVVTFDYVDLADAVGGFGRATLLDGVDGLSIQPIDRRTRVRHEGVTVEAGDLVYDISPLSLRPGVSGAPTPHGELFWKDDVTLMFVSDSATVYINRWMTSPGESAEQELRLTDSHVSEVSAGLSARWDHQRRVRERGSVPS